MPIGSCWPCFFVGLGPIHLLLENNGCCPDTLLTPCYAPFELVEASIHYKPKLCIKAPKVCVWAAPSCVWAPPDRLKGWPWKKKKEEGWSNNYMGPYHVGVEIVVPAVSTPSHACVLFKTHILIRS